MVCKNCGRKLKNNEKFCTECGYYNDDDDFSLEGDSFEEEETEEEEDAEVIVVDEEEYEDYDSSEENSSKKEKKSKKKSEQKVISLDDIDSLMELYIGEDYKWICERPFNIYALIFSWMYFLYRKLYLIGILGLALTGLVLYFLMGFIVPYIILVMVLSGIFFNKIYLVVIRRRIRRILNKTEGIDEYTIQEKCRKKGGVSVFNALSIFVIFLVIMILCFIDGVSLPQETPKFWDKNTENLANCKSVSKQTYQILKDNKIDGSLEESICEVHIGDSKTYDTYFKLKKDSVSQYYYFKNEGNYFTLEGNTEKLEYLEEEKENGTISEEEEKMLTITKNLSSKFASLKKDAEYEDRLISEGLDTSEKAHYVFGKDDILK